MLGMSSSTESTPPLPPFLDRVSSGTEVRAPPRRSPWKVIGAIVVVAIFIVGVIFIAGVFPRPNGTTSTPTFSDAQQAANSAAGGYHGGGWSGLAAVAFATVQATEFTATQIEEVIGAVHCTVTWNPSAPQIIRVPATPAGTSTGGASSWFFLYSNSALALLTVVVTNGSAQPLFTATGGSCALVPAALQPLSGVVDSSTAVAAANAKGGTSFLATYPEVNRTWAVASPLLVGPTWIVNYSECPIPPPVNASVHSVEFNATVDAQTGVVLTHEVTDTVCSLNLSFTLPVTLLHAAGLLSELYDTTPAATAPKGLCPLRAN